MIPFMIGSIVIPNIRVDVSFGGSISTEITLLIHP
jgi:hypothetical protein